MDSWIVPVGTAAAVGLVGMAAVYATSDPSGYTVDVKSLLDQSEVHPVIPACRTPKVQLPVDETSTLYDVFEEAVKRFGDHDFLGWRSSPATDFDNWLTYKQVLERVTNVGYGLRWLNQQPNNDTLVGVFSKNRAEMVLTQLACYQHSMVIVPMYDTLGDEGIIHIVNQTKMEVIICDDEDKIKNLLKWGHDQLPSVKTLVHMNSVGADTVAAVESQGWTILSFEKLESEGKNNPVDQMLCGPEDLCVICYTSGTTGKPKGAMIQHKGLNNVAKSSVSLFTQSLLQKDILVDGAETHISYLPLAHMYEQTVMVCVTAQGGKIGFYSGDVKELLNDIKYLRPTYFPSVPRLMNRIYDKVMAGASKSRIKSYLLKKALHKKEKYFKRGIITKSTLWDKLVFKKLQDLLGGRVKIIVTGAAPISTPVLRFFRLAFGAVVCEGYGQTECSAAMSGSVPGEQEYGEVGPPLSCNIIKLADVPEMNYFAAENVGEVCCKGINVFKGYLHDEAKTREAIDEDGWLHTGDIGRWTERGTLKIVDRKKNIFKLSQGEYVAPEKIENVYMSCSLVAQCFVHGDSLQSALVGVVVPDPETLPAYAKSELGLSTTSMEELCKNEKVKAAVMKAMASAAKTFNLKGFEQVRDIHMVAEAFTVENNLLTPTFKLKRVESRTKYKDVIAEMYSKMK